jgi:hypothetical protein
MTIVDDYLLLALAAILLVTNRLGAAFGIRRVRSRANRRERLRE